MMEIELNSAGDNPLVLVDEEAIVSVGQLRRDLAGDGVRLHPARHRARRPGRQRARPEAALGATSAACRPGSRAQDGPTGGLRPLGRSFAALASEARFLANPVSLDYRGQLAEGVEDHASMAPLAVSADLDAGQPGAPAGGARADRRRAGGRPARRAVSGSAPAPRGAYAFVREFAGSAHRRDRVERRHRGARARSSATAQLARRVARVAGARPALSEHEPPGI